METNYPHSSGNDVVTNGGAALFDPIQGGIGDCYLIAASAAVADRIDIKKNILT